MADGTTPTVPGQDKLLAALYACHKRNGKGARVDFALQSRTRCSLRRSLACPELVVSRPRH